MGEFDWGRGDRFAYARYYEQSTFTYNDATAGNRLFTMPAGWYYTLHTASGFWQNAMSYYKQFEVALNAAIAASASANRFAVVAATPANCNTKYFADSTVRLNRTAGALNWTLSLTNDEARNLLGADGIFQYSNSTDTGNQIVPGRWQSPVDTCDRRKWARREAFRATAGRTSYSNWWDEFYVREFDWKAVPASHVRNNPYPVTLGVQPVVWDGRPGRLTALGGEARANNSFSDMWEWALRGGYPISARYDISSMPLDPSTWPAENLKPIDAAWEDMSNAASNFGPNELYRIQFKAEVI
jgi:hypothetical protein